MRRPRHDDARNSPCETRPEDVFIGSLEGFKGKLSTGAPACVTPTAALAHGSEFPTLIARFQHARGIPDRGAAVSFWSQCYFSTLLIPVLAVLVAEDRALPIGLNDLSMTVCARTGMPLAFHMPHACGPAHGCGGTQGFRCLLDQHVAPLIATLRQHSGLSSRLFWENAGWSMVWAFGELGRLHPAARPRIETLLASRCWPKQAAGVLEPMVASLVTGAPLRRRVCCLRYGVPGFSACESICPRCPGGPPPRH